MGTFQIKHHIVLEDLFNYSTTLYVFLNTKSLNSYYNYIYDILKKCIKYILPIVLISRNNIFVNNCTYKCSSMFKIVQHIFILIHMLKLETYMYNNVVFTYN